MSTNLGWTAIAPQDTGKVGLLNAIRNTLDAAASEVYSIPADTSLVLTLTEFQNNMAYKFLAGSTVLQSLTVPDGLQRLFGVYNQDPTITMAIIKGTTVYYVAPNSGELFYTLTGADALYSAGPLNSDTEPKVKLLNFYSNKTYGASELIGQHVIVHDSYLPVSLTNAVFKAHVGPTGGAVSLPIRKNGTQIGSVDFALSATSATFTFATQTDFTPGDLITIEGPASADAGLSGVFGVLEFTLIYPADTAPGAIPQSFTSVGSTTFATLGPSTYPSVGSITFITPGPNTYPSVGSVTFVKPV